MIPKEEIFDLVDDDDRVIGRATRNEVHGNPKLLHRVVHVLVFDSLGRLYLQKRADDKDVQPGKWDTSVGGHVDAGEDRETAALRELSEELGIPGNGALTFPRDADAEGAEFRMIVDPIDGTVNYFYGIPHFCVSIALREKGVIRKNIVPSTKEFVRNHQHLEGISFPLAE